MKRLLFILLLFVSLAAYSQDVIILRNGDRIDCKITKVDSAIVYCDLQRGDRILSSFFEKREIRSYRINSKGKDVFNDGILSRPGNKVIIDTSKYVKEISEWVNLISYSHRLGFHTTGWSVQYQGFFNRNTSKWAIPLILGIEVLKLSGYYFSQFDYDSFDMAYFKAGVSPLYKLNDLLFLKLGINIIIGKEKIEDNDGNESSDNIFGFAPSQGIQFIAKEKLGLTLGISIYERLLNSEVYKNDLGLKIELGIKF